MDITVILLATIGLITLIYAASKTLMRLIDQIAGGPIFGAPPPQPPQSFAETQDDFMLAIQRCKARDQGAA